MRWRTAPEVVVAVALAVTAGCGTSDSTTGTEPEVDTTAVPDANVEGFEWTQAIVDIGLMGGGTVPLGEGFIGVRVDPDKVMGSDPHFGAIAGMTVVTSPDGSTWTDASGVGAAEQEAVHWADGGPWGAVGYVATMEDEESPPTELIFTTDGAEFARSTPPAQLTGLDGTVGILRAACAESGIVVLVGVMGPQGVEGAAALFSSDMQTWEPVDLDVPEGWELMRVTGSPAGFLLTGEVPGPAGSGSVPGFVSADGRDWQPFSLPEPDAVVVSQTGWRDGFAVVTREPAQLLASPDGLEWDEMAGQPLADIEGADLTGSSLGVLAFGWPSMSGEQAPDDHSAGPVGPVLVFTGDGQTWNRWSDAAPFMTPDLYPEGIVLGEEAVLVHVLTESDGPPTQTELWIGTPTQS